MGLKDTRISGVKVFWSKIASPPVPLVYQEGILILLGGSKEGITGGERFTYRAGDYIVLTVPLPAECAQLASPEEPLFGLFIDIDRQALGSLLGQIVRFGEIATDMSPGLISPMTMGEGMSSAAQRLFSILDDPLSAEIIGPNLRKEILFYVLQGPRGAALAQFAQQRGRDDALEDIIRAFRDDLAKPVNVADLARRVGMSVSAFHRAFKAKTGVSPLQYVKCLRLHRAREMISFEGARSGQAALKVGYESTSQFSREFKRYFGQPASAHQTPLLEWLS